MSAVPAYRSYAVPEPSWHERPRFDVTPGREVRSRERAHTSGPVTVAVGIAVAIVLVALLAVARIAITSLTVTEASEAQAVSTEIEGARSAAAELEVVASTLSNTANIRADAQELGMAQPQDEYVITLEEDIVASDENGSLVLSESIERASKAYGSYE